MSDVTGAPADASLETMIGVEPKPQQVAVREPKAPITTGHRVAALVPTSLSDVIRLATVIHDSRLAPGGFKDAAAITVAILTGMELGLAPMASLRSLAVINGRASIWGDAGMAMPRQSGLLILHREEFSGEPYNDDFTAHCRIQRKGEEPVEGTFSVADAKMANLWDGLNIEDSGKRRKAPWVSYPKRMLMWRARTVFRDVFPDVLLGMRFAEEARDDETNMIDVTPRQAAEPAGSGIASRLPGTNGASGYGRDVQEAMNGGGDERKGEAEPGGAGAPIVAATGADNRTDAQPGAGEAGRGGEAAAGQGSQAQPPGDAGPAALSAADKDLLNKFNEDMVTAVKPAEVEAVWAAFREEIDHASPGARQIATDKYEKKKAAAEKAAKKPSKKV